MKRPQAMRKVLSAADVASMLHVSESARASLRSPVVDDEELGWQIDSSDGAVGGPESSDPAPTARRLAPCSVAKTAPPTPAIPQHTRGTGSDGGMPAPEFPSIVQLNVGGQLFSTRLRTLRARPGMLASMFSGRHRVDTDAEGRYFIDRDGTHFRHILNFLRDSSVPSPGQVPVDELIREAQFYHLDDLEACLALRYPGIAAAYAVRDAVSEPVQAALESLERSLVERAISVAQTRRVLQVMVLLAPSSCAAGHSQEAIAPPATASHLDVLVFPTPLLEPGKETVRRTLAQLLEVRLQQQGFDAHACGPDEDIARVTCCDRACRRALVTVGLMLRFATVEASTPSASELTHSILHLLRRLTAAGDGSIRIGKRGKV